MKLTFKELSKSATMPTKEHATDSGFDLYASETVVINPNNTKVVKTDVSVELPKGYEAVIRPRSGITSKTKLRVQLGTIDNEYIGELGVIVDNIHPLGKERVHAYELVDGHKMYMSNNGSIPKGTYKIRKGDKIAQLIVQPLVEVESNAVLVNDAKSRDSKGFGSSGTNAKKVTLDGKEVAKTASKGASKGKAKTKATTKKKAASKTTKKEE